MALVLLALDSGGPILVNTHQIVLGEMMSPPVTKLTLTNGKQVTVLLSLKDVQALDPTG